MIGATALYLTYAWLLSAIVASYLSHRKGYGEKPGLASGLLLNAIGVLIWLVVPAREDSLWKKLGPVGRSKQDKADAARAEETRPAADAKPAGDAKPADDAKPSDDA